MAYMAGLYMGLTWADPNRLLSGVILQVVGMSIALSHWIHGTGMNLPTNLP